MRRRFFVLVALLMIAYMAHGSQTHPDFERVLTQDTSKFGTTPCPQKAEYDSAIEEINEWEQLLLNSAELESDLELLNAVRKLIVAARQSASKVYADTSATKLSVTVVSGRKITTALVQLKSQVKMDTKVIQGVFFDEIQSIMTQISDMEGSQGKQDIDNLAQTIIVAIDALRTTLSDLISRKASFSTLIAQLEQKKTEILSYYNSCYNKTPKSAVLEKVVEESTKPQSAIIEKDTDIQTTTRLYSIDGFVQTHSRQREHKKLRKNMN